MDLYLVMDQMIKVNGLNNNVKFILICKFQDFHFLFLEFEIFVKFENLQIFFGVKNVRFSNSKKI